MTSARRSLSVSRHAFENPVGAASEIVADWNHRAVRETDARTMPESIRFQEDHQLGEYTAFKPDEPVI